jgi:hypothetical protein
MESNTEFVLAAVVVAVPFEASSFSVTGDGWPASETHTFFGTLFGVPILIRFGGIASSDSES